MLLGIVVALVIVLGLFYGMKRLTYQGLLFVPALTAYVMAGLFVAASPELYPTNSEALFKIALNGTVLFALLLGVSYVVFRKKLKLGTVLPTR